MRNLDELFTKHANEVKSEFDKSQRHKLVALHEKTLRKIRRRRLLKRATGSLVVACVALVYVMFASLPSGRTGLAGSAPLAMGGSVALDPHSEFGLWPFVERDLSQHVCASNELEGSRQVAVSFAETVFGWSNAVVIGENNYGSHITSTVAELRPGFAEGPLPPLPVIKLYLERLNTGNCWWVTGIRDPDNGAHFSASLDDGDLDVRFDLIPGAVRADVLVVEESNNLRRVLHTDAGQMDARLTGFRGPGAVIVLWKNAHGVVFSAAGVTVSVGDTSIEPL